MKKNLLGSLVAMSMAMGITAQANAADWNGAYAGASIGYSSLGGDFIDVDMTYFPSVKVDSSGGNGGFFGAQVGYNVQSASLVYGFEADMMANLGSNAHSSDGNGCGSSTFEADFKGKGSARGRLGMASASNDLFYLTGGVAFAAIDHHHFDCELRGTSSKIYTGWTIGAGWERMLGNNVSMRVQLDYADYGKKTWTDQSDENFGLDPKTITLGAGLNYRF